MSQGVNIYRRIGLMGVRAFLVAAAVCAVWAGGIWAFGMVDIKSMDGFVVSMSAHTDRNHIETVMATHDAWRGGAPLGPLPFTNDLNVRIMVAYSEWEQRIIQWTSYAAASLAAAVAWFTALVVLGWILKPISR